MSGGFSSTTFSHLLKEIIFSFSHSFTTEQGLCRKILVCLISKDVYVKLSFGKMFM